MCPSAANRLFRSVGGQSAVSPSLAVGEGLDEVRRPKRVRSSVPRALNRAGLAQRFLVFDRSGRRGIGATVPHPQRYPELDQPARLL